MQLKMIVMIMISMIVNLNTALAKNLDNVNSSTHFPNQSSRITGMEVQWYCAGITNGNTYYAAFSKDLTLTFSDYDPQEPELPPQSLNDPALEFPFTGNTAAYTPTVDGYYYFNIVIDDGDYGATESIGPFIIDTTAPTPVSITGLSNTQTNSIELTLDAADATEYCILKNNTNIGACSWESVPENRTAQSPTLDEGSNRIYAFFRDAAQNMNQDFIDVIYVVSKEDERQDDDVFVVPALNDWGMLVFVGFLMIFALRNIQLNIKHKKNWTF
jgi:hypothetical protein